MGAALNILGLVTVVGFVSAGSRRLGVAEPLTLIVVGLGISYVPHVLDIALAPNLVLIGLLPPLLYAAAIRTSLVDFRANRAAIALLSVGLVAVSTITVGLVAWWAIPGATLAVGMALGAVVAPPDAVSATTIARKVGIPRRIVSVLEAESLVNDATALVALNTAIAAITSSITPAHVGWDFVRAAGGGLLIGGVAAAVLSFLRKLIDDPVLDTTLSFAAPYVAFLPAEKVHASGVLVVVVTGLALGHRAPVLQSAASRVSENINWRTVQFLLENVVFLLIGLQIRPIVDGARADHVAWSHAIPACLLVLAATVAIRAIWVFGWSGLLRLARRPLWTWAECAVISWSGMRGVVTLAAAFLLPTTARHRDTVLLVAFFVVAVTLLVQGTTLPWLLRRLRLPGPDVAEDALQAAMLINEASRAGLAVLDDLVSPEDPPEVVTQLRERGVRRSNQLWEQLGRPSAQIEPPSAVYHRLRVQMLAAERSAILAARDRGTYDDEVLRSALGTIDLEESMLDRVQDASVAVGHELTTPYERAGNCEHLNDAPRVIAARTPNGCEECLRDGTRWLHLRLCLTCGHVGCCDSSPQRHARQHFNDVEHPVMRSFEPSETWRWCYIDQHVG